MIISQSVVHPLDNLEPVADISQIMAIQQRTKRVHLDDAVASYLVSIIRQTREHGSLFLGASPRATLALVQATKAYALLHERDYVIPDDIKFLAPYVLGHRLILNAEARMDGATVQSILQSVFQQVRVPVRMEK
jgi:MoxR-like ATPase